MPKLPLDPARLRELKDLRGPALRALRHPRRTATQAVNGAVSVVGFLLSRRQTDEPVPGAASESPVPPPTDLATGPDEVAPPTASSPASTTPDSPATAEADTDTEPDTEADTEPGTEAEPEPDTELDTEPDTEAAVTEDDAPEEHLAGPAPHIPPHIAKDVERDFDEDIPGISPGQRN